MAAARFWYRRSRSISISPIIKRRVYPAAAAAAVLSSQAGAHVQQYAMNEQGTAPLSYRFEEIGSLIAPIDGDFPLRAAHAKTVRVLRKVSFC